MYWYIINSSEKYQRMLCAEYGIKNDTVCEVYYIFTRYVLRFFQYIILILT
jgi:hypothetical protein